MLQDLNFLLSVFKTLTFAKFKLGLKTSNETVNFLL